MRPRHVIGVSLACFVGLIFTGIAGACPPGTIAATGDAIITPIGPIIVESCVSESGGNTTFTYDLIGAGGARIDLCMFLIPGFGTFPPVLTTEPLGFSVTITEASGCATWWVWEGAPVEILPGSRITISLTFPGPVASTEREAHLKFCDGTRLEASVLAPSSCSDITDDPVAGCFCSGSGALCESTSRPEREGTRIIIFGPDFQAIPVCSGSWLRHGWSFEDELDRYDFRLEIDGVDIPLERTDFCMPGDTPGSGHITSTWEVQFPPNHFDVLETYEFTGMWIDYEAPPGERVIHSNSIEVRPLLCVFPLTGPATEETHGITLACPDLAIESVETSCVCGWNQQQQFECTLDVEVVVANDGDVSAGAFLVLLETPEGDVRQTLPELGAGKSRRITLRLPLDGVVCPLDFAVTVDATAVIDECNEGNNVVAGDVCCK